MPRISRRTGGLSIRINGVRATIRDLARWDRRVTKAAQDQTLTDGNKLFQDARTNAPVATGRLRDSIRIRYFEDAPAVLISVEVPYAAFVEFANQGRDQFLIPLHRRAKRRFSGNLRRRLRKLLR